METEIVASQGFVRCDICPVLNMCTIGSAGISIRLGRYEGALITPAEMGKVNELLQHMNNLVEKCPLVTSLNVLGYKRER